MKRRLAVGMSALAWIVAGPARAEDAGAPPSCADGAPPVYVAGSTAAEPFLKVLAPAIAADGYKIAYVARSSCEGVEAMVGVGGDRARLRHLDGVAKVLDALTNSRTCAVPPSTAADVGVSDVFATTCPGMGPLPVDVGDFFGPNQVMTLAVPRASTQLAISAEAAHFVLGAGGRGGMAVEPWTDPDLFFVRSAQSGTQQMVSRAARLNAARVWGVDRRSSGGVVAGLVDLDARAGTPEGLARAERAIGLLAASDVDAHRDHVRALAFQTFGQLAAFGPDGAPGSGDRRNVREGRYAIWGPLHFFAATDPQSGALRSARARLVVGPFAASALPRELVHAAIDAGAVPACAMRVERTTEIGPLSLRTQPGDCHCLFDARTRGRTSCRACDSDADCAEPGRSRCSFGYCEAK